LLVENYFQPPSLAWATPWPSRIFGGLAIGSARRTPTERRKVGRREAGREVARRNRRWPREDRKVGSRVGIELRREFAAGAGRSFRRQTVRVTERRLPWRCRTRPELRLSDTIARRRRRLFQRMTSPQVSNQAQFCGLAHGL